VKPKNGRFKWEPAVLMTVVLGLGLWIAFGPASRPHLDSRPNAVRIPLRVGDERGALELTYLPDGTPTFRTLMRGSHASRDYTEDEVKTMFGEIVLQEVLAPRSNWLFKTMNITSWVGVVWLCIGLLGQLAFSGRMVIQWIVSEKRKQSVITESFWWFSLFGSLLLFAYFAWRQEPIGLLGQATGIVIYFRNLRLIYKQRRRLRKTGSLGVADDPTSEPSLDTETRNPEEYEDASGSRPASKQRERGGPE
jgi:lipid-A-disaccharide synthase-like uncharacterized protein